MCVRISSIRLKFDDIHIIKLYMLKNFPLKRRVIIFLVTAVMAFTLLPKFSRVSAMPFYGLKPAEKLVTRASFFTSYSSSTLERKHNIALASSSINGTFLDVGEEFSFNRVVGSRTEKRGYKSAKIILDGEFVDGVGGGVCQVSTTLYNAVLLSGLKVTEYHPHSLQVSYVAPSFDAMVSGVSDLRFVNNTDNPIIVYMRADGNRVTASILGQSMACKYERRSEVVGKIDPPPTKVIRDEKGEYPDLLVGETKVLRYAKEGLKSQGFLVKIVNGKVVKTERIRNDSYKAIGGVIVEGTANTIENNDFNSETLIEKLKNIILVKNRLNL